jgi:hypothetical protein
MEAGKEKNKPICFDKLYQQALTVAKESKLEELYEKTKLPISWLRKFRAGSIQNPSVRRIENILVTMTGAASTK